MSFVVLAGQSVDPHRVRIVQVAVVGDREAEGPHGPALAAQREVHAPLHVNNSLVAKHSLDAAERVLGVGPGAHELDGAADVAAAVQRALRPFENLDALQVAETRGRIGEELYIVKVETYTLRVTEGAQPSNGYVGKSVEARGKVEIGHLETDVLQALDILPTNIRARNHGNRLRNLQEILFPPVGGNDYFLDRPRGALLRHRCRGW